MKIVIAPDSYKESLSALEVASCIEAGFREIFPDCSCTKVPVADGGEGTVEALVAATRGRVVTRRVTGPLGIAVEASFGLSGDEATAFIEVAAASGLALIPARDRDPMRTTTVGVGELIRAALDLGARHIIIGLGGSATNDGGAGMAQVLGARLLDSQGMPLPHGGGALATLAHIDPAGLDPRLAACRVEVACDVDNPLCGPSGASAIFGPQKGATPQMVQVLDRNLHHYAMRIREDLGRSVLDMPGSGAAGGLGAGLVAFLDATLKPGAEIVMEAVGLDALVAQADLVITGEGRIDGQTIHGKTPIGVARVAGRHGKPVIAIAGSLGTGAGLVHRNGIDAMFSVVPRSCSIEEALAEAAENVRVAARNIAASLRIGQTIAMGSARRPLGAQGG